MSAPRRRNPRRHVPASDPLLSADEALRLAEAVERWPGSFARVLVGGRPLPGGYKPFVPPPPNADT